MATNALGFVDDVNILVYGTSTEENIKSSEASDKQCKT